MTDKIEVGQADIAAALSHLGFDSVADLHYWAKDNNELNRFDTLTQLLARHRMAACEPTEMQATALEFGEEVVFAAIGLETEPQGTNAMFEIELRNRQYKVTVAAITKDIRP